MMTKRARYTTEEVLLAVDSDNEDDYDVDDPGEPFMDGSDEFSDLDAIVSTSYAGMVS